MTIPKTIFRYDKRSEAVRILLTATNISNGFYRDENFIVLPESTINDPGIVIFPRLPYKRINDFWKISKKISGDPEIQHQKAISEISNNLTNTIPDYSRMEKSWRKKEKSFWRTTKSMFPGMFDKVKCLEIRPAKYGTISTCFSTLTKDKRKITVYVRIGCDISHIAEAILIDGIYRQKPATGTGWKEKEAIIDFFLTRTTLAKLFPAYSKTLSGTNQKQRAYLKRKSKLYLRSLGVATPGHTIFKTDTGWKISGKKIKFSVAEESLFQELYNKINHAIGFDALAEALWKEESYDRFSNCAIVKTVERLRKRLADAGINPIIIQACKKQGYMMVN